MKRFLLLFLFVVNLQIVVQNRSISICIFTEAYAQHMTKEEHDNCYEEGYGWYLSPFSDCRDIIVTSYKCSYCGAAFDYPSDRSLHEKTCPQNPNVKKEEEQPSNPENNNGTGNSGGGTSGGDGGGTGGGTGNWNPSYPSWPDTSDPSHWHPASDDKTIKFKDSKIPSEWEKQERNKCFMKTMEYIANYYWGNTDGGYNFLDKIYKDDYFDLSGANITANGIDPKYMGPLLEFDNFNYMFIPGEDLSQSIPYYSDKDYAILYIWSAKIYDENNVLKPTSHASMAIGYKEGGDYIIIVDPASGSIQYVPKNKGLCAFAIEYPYTENFKTK